MNWTVWAALFGTMGLFIGAYGVAVLSDRLPLSDMALFKKAVVLQCLHSLALIGCDLVQSWPHSNPAASALAISVAGWCFVAGIVLYCGSLFALAGTDFHRAALIKPIGATVLLAGWVAFGLGVWQASTTVRNVIEPQLFK